MSEKNNQELPQEVNHVDVMGMQHHYARTDAQKNTPEAPQMNQDAIPNPPQPGNTDDQTQAPNDQEMAEDDFRYICKSLIKDNMEYYRVTNKGLNRAAKDKYYELYCDRKVIRITQYSSTSKREQVFDYAKDALFLNGQQLPIERETEFVKMINKIGRDLGERRAEMFEKPKK